MKTIWDANVRKEITNRLAKLTPDTPARWGKFTAPQMLAHLVDAFRMANGEVQTASKKLPIRFAPIKQLIIYGPPFPKSSPTAPELLVRKPDDWATECANLRSILDGFATRSREKPFPTHPAFGKLSRQAWGALGYKHTDHHFKQFGV